MLEAHKEVSRYSLSAIVQFDEAWRSADLYWPIRLAVAECIWQRISAQPALLGRFIDDPFRPLCVKRMVNDWIEHLGENLDQQLIYLGDHYPAQIALIQKFRSTAMLNPSRTMRSLGQDIELCAKSLASRRLDMPDVYLWLNLDPPFDWPAQGEALRALLGDVNWVRGKYCTRLKVFLTPASLGRLQGTTQGPGFDEQIAQENLAWKIDTLYDVADDVCKIMGVAPFRQLFDPDRLGEYLGQMPSMIPMTPGAWIVLARQAGALAQQHGCMVLSDALWDEALVSFCRLHRPLRLAGGKVYAFGRELELDKSWIEVLQAIQAWNQDASRHELHPRAKDIAETINSKKPEASRRRASARSVHTAISRLRDEPQFEPVFHRHKHISLATARKHLVYLKGDDEGYYLDNMLM